MRKLLLILAIVFSPSISLYSQYYIDYGISAGLSSYLGEIGGGEGIGRGGISDLGLDVTRWSLGGFYRYKFSSVVGVKGALNYIRIGGDDANSTNPNRQGRNLNFKNDMLELMGNVEFYLYKINDVGRTGRYSTDFNLYAFSGFGLFYSNPKAQLENGSFVALQPLQTEGVKYSKWNFNVPIGIGFYYTIDRRYRIGMDVNWRVTFTDYIDDISDRYVEHTDPEIAAIANPSSQEILNSIVPTEEIAVPPLETFSPGRRRGNPEKNDSYASVMFNLSWTVRGRSNFYKSKNSWVLGKRKRRRRKSRAKF